MDIRLNYSLDTYYAKIIPSIIYQVLDRINEKSTVTGEFGERFNLAMCWVLPKITN